MTTPRPPNGTRAVVHEFTDERRAQLSDVRPLSVSGVYSGVSLWVYTVQTSAESGNLNEGVRVGE